MAGGLFGSLLHMELSTVCRFLDNFMNREMPLLKQKSNFFFTKIPQNNACSYCRKKFVDLT